MFKLQPLPFGSYYLLIVTIVVICWFLLHVIGLQILRRQSKKVRLHHLILSNNVINHGAIILVAISFFGLTMGILAGNSRAPAVDAVITLGMTVYGGLTLYWFTKEAGVYRVLSALTLIVFSINLLYGIYLGAYERVNYEGNLRKYNEQLLFYQSELKIYEQRVQTKKSSLSILGPSGTVIFSDSIPIPPSRRMTETIGTGLLLP